MYLPDLKKILFNEDWLLIANWLEVIKTAFHETRHAYQHYCILTNSRESKATISIWKQEFEHYFQPNNGKQSSNDINYLQQRIEEDAVNFSNVQIDRLINPA